jgi:signal transduction histidine kinase
MMDPFLSQQQALYAGIQTSDARVRQYSEEMALGVIRQYELILGFLQYIKPVLAQYPELNIFYFPVESEQLLCVYQTVDLQQPVPVELRSYQAETRRHARELFNQTTNTGSLSFLYPSLDVQAPSYRHGTHIRHRELLIDLISTILGGHLPRSYPKGATSLVVCCPIPEQIKVASSHLRELPGVLIFFGDEQSFAQASHSSLADTIKKEFNRYFAETGRYAIRELDFFLSSLMNQDERIQDNQNRALGFIAHMVVHRFRNFRQVAEFIVQEFPTAVEVISHPQLYEDKIRAMQTQLHRAQRLEKQLAYIGQPPQNAQLSISELVDVFEYVLDEIKAYTNNPVFLDADVPNDLRKEYVIAPASMLKEVFSNHLENILREIDRPDVENKKLTLRIYSKADSVYVDLIHYGAPLSPDTLEDLQRTVRVRRPSGSGLGMFLSTMIMRHVGGDQEITSPLLGSDKGVCITLRFPRFVDWKENNHGNHSHC